MIEAGRSSGRRTAGSCGAPRRNRETAANRESIVATRLSAGQERMRADCAKKTSRRSAIERRDRNSRLVRLTRPCREPTLAYADDERLSTRGHEVSRCSMCWLAHCVSCCPVVAAASRSLTPRVDRFPIRSDAFQLDRATHSGAFFDVVGRRSALFGYENRSFEAWVYPLKILDDFALSFRLDGYPLDIDGRDIMASIHVRPEATTLVVRARGVHRAADHVRADRRAGDRHPSRRRQRAAADDHGVVPAARSG